MHVNKTGPNNGGRPMTETNELVAHARGGHSWLEAGSGLASGETIVFLHPIVGTSSYWTPQLVELSDRWRCIAWDAPGYRGTDPVEEPLAASVTQRLAEFFDVAGVSSAHIVGLSLGGMIALHAANDHADRFDRLIVADTSAAFGIDPHEWLAEWLGPLRAGMPLRQVVADSIDAITTIAPDVALREQIVASFADVSDDAFEAASRYIAFHDVRERLPGIANETLVLVGELDGETPPMYGEEIASLLPNATFRVLPGLGHLTSIEAPDMFTAMIRDFLQ